MGSFNTSLDDEGNVDFSISSNWWWWWYLAFTLPLTVLVLFTMGRWYAYERWWVGRQKILDLESDKQSC